MKFSFCEITKNENFAATLCRSAVREGGGGGQVRPRILHANEDCTVFTVFHSVIYNSVIATVALELLNLTDSTYFFKT